VISLVGADPQTIEVGSAYSELGATASDNYDGDLTASIVIDASAVDTSTLGSYQVTYNVTDSNGNPAIEVIRTVDVVNAAPTLAPLPNQTVDELASVGFTAAANDPDPSDILNFSLSGAPAGAGIDPSSGAFTWTPTESQGPNVYTFDVVVTDAGTPARSDSQSITITVYEVNVAPSLGAVATQSGDEQTSIAFSIPASDPDLPANSHTFTLSGAPAGAGVDPVTGDFTWVPTEAQGPGTYVFDVTVVDDGSPSLGDTTSVTVTVAETNTAPVVTSPGAQSSSENAAVALGVVAGDSDDPANTLSYAATGLPPGLTIDPGTGAIAGTIGYTANAASPYAVTVTVTDDGSPVLTGETTFSWVVADVNRDPVAVNDAVSVAEDSSAFIDASSNDSDPDGDSLAVLSVSSPAHGSASVSGGGIVYVPDGNYNGSDSLTYTVSDGRGGSDVGAINVTVTPVNDAPVLAAISNRTVQEQQSVGFTAAATDVDGNSVTFTLSGAPSGASITAGGVFSWVPSEAQGPGSYTFDVVATDAGAPSRSGSTSVTVTVTEVNAAPVVTNPGNQTSREQDAVSLSIQAADTDVPSNTLRYSATGLPPGLALDAASGLITGTVPFYAASGSPYVVTVTATDDGSPRRSASTAFLWYVYDTNRAPVAADLTISATAGRGAPVFLTGTDPDGDVLTYRIEDAPARGALSGGPRNYIYTPGPAASGVDTFTFSVSDGDLSAVGTVTINITPNAAPVGGDDAFHVRRGGLLTVEAPGVLANDYDPDGAPMAAMVVVQPEHGTVEMDTDGSFRYEHDGDEEDVDSFQYRIDDGMRQSGLIDVRITIDDNVAPVAVAETIELDEDHVVTFRPLDNDWDPNNEPVVLAEVGDARNGTLAWNVDGTFSYTPDRDFYGTDSFSYFVTDGDLWARGTVTLVIKPVNDAPRAQNAVTIGRSGEILTVDLRPYAIDVDGDVLSFLLESPPTSGVRQVEPGVFEIDMSGIIHDLPGLAFVVSDPAGERSAALLEVTVEIPAELVGAPSLVSDNVAFASVLGGGDGDGDGVIPCTDHPSFVVGLRLMIGSVLGTFKAMRFPLFLLALLLVASLYLGYSRRFDFLGTPTALPFGDKRRVGVIMAPSCAGVAVRTEPGSHQKVLARLEPTQAGVVATGGRTMVRNEVWVEVETPAGDGWVDAEFLSEEFPAAAFDDDGRVADLIEDLVDRIYGSDDLLPVTGGHDLRVASYGPPVRFSANALKRLMIGASVFWWWGPTGDTLSAQRTFAEEVGESLAAAYRTRPGHTTHCRYPVPLEFANMHSMVVGDEESEEAWRIFIRYEKGEPFVAALMREVEPNPGAMHGMPVCQPV